MHQFSPLNKSHGLQLICDANYDRLLRLAPDLLKMQGQKTASVGGKPSLYISIIDRTRYTLTIELSHFFEHSMGAFSEPALKIRAYLDIKSVEVLCDHYRPQVEHAFRRPGMHREIMEYKWNLNYFLEKWLTHCIHLGYEFEQKESLKALTV